MVKGLFRVSLLLFLVSAVGLAGLNRGLDPRNVQVIQAHAIIIQLTTGNTLTFQVNSTCEAMALAPGDVCTAAVGIENTGEGAYTLSQPVPAVTGPLNDVCGAWFSVAIAGQSYVADSHVVDIGDTESFQVVATFDLAAPNQCQDLLANILITLTATATEDHTPTPTATNTPQDVTGGSLPTSTPPATATLVNETQGTRATPVPTLTSEVLPSRFPSTGQGIFDDESGGGLLRTLFIGTALIGAGFFLLSLRLRAAEKQPE